MSNSPSDEVLMLAFRDGDASAFDILYGRFKGPMFRYLSRQCGNSAVAEELFQDVWMNLVRTRERYEVKASFSTFVYHMAHNRLIDHYRKHAGRIPISYDENSDDSDISLVDRNIQPVENQLDNQRQVNELLNAITELPEAQREAFLLKEESGLSLDGIADATGVNRETVKSRLRYAIKKLRTQMKSSEL